MTDDETWVDDDIANTLNAFDAGDTRTTHAIVEPIGFYPTGGSQNGFLATDGVSPTLKRGSTIGAESGMAIAEVANALDRQAGGPDDNSAQANHLIPHVAPTLTRHNLDSRSPQSEEQQRIVNTVHEATMSVRRLTPVECERLMGWPDNWTAPPGIKAPDSKRYAEIGRAHV